MVALTFRGLSFWLPLLLGFFLLHKHKVFSVEHRIFELKWSVRVVSILTALTGLVNLLSSVTPVLSSRLGLGEDLIHLAIRFGSRLTTALAGFALLLLSINLWRRKRTAWLLTEIVLVITIISFYLKDRT